MKTILALTCCLALTAVVRAEDEADKAKTNVVKTKAVKTQVHGGQFKTNANTLPAVQSNTTVKSNKFQGTKFHSNQQLDSNVHVKTGNNAQFKKQNWSNQNSVQTNADVNVQKGWDGKSKKWSKTGNANFQNQSNAAKAWKIKKFSVQNSPNSKIASMKFKQNYKIQGSQNWKGQKYWAFQNYNSQWHDKGWWHNHHSKIILISGGYYYWDNGYWAPAWGYDTNYEYYPYDGPIYGYNDLPPDQVIANVQSALQEQGYYQGEVDGLLGPLTRAALANYQQEHGLYATSAIDQPTLESLGMG